MKNQTRTRKSAKNKTQRSSKRKKKNSGLVKNSIKNFVLSTEGFPFVLTLTVVSILFVLFRMKGIEQEYQLAELNKLKGRLVFETKELRAKRARLLSVKNLNRLAKKYNMKEPTTDQVIIIP
jgi:hypothetical protein